MNLWRINLKPANRTGYDSRKYCLDNKIVGIGWPLDDITESVTSETYESLGKLKYQLNAARGWSNAWNAIYYNMQINDLVWTRTTDGNYFLGRITSEWRYDYSTDAVNNDIANIRDCEWVKVGIIDNVPGKVVRSFIPASTLQRVVDETALIYSQQLFNDLSGLNLYESTFNLNRDFFSLLSADDCEDIVGLYLQVKFDYIIIPSSCKDDTIAYEYELIHRTSSEKAVVQVKNGNVDLNRDNYRKIEANVFLFTTKGKYTGDEASHIKCLTTFELEDFLIKYSQLLPRKIKFWMNSISIMKKE